MVKQERLAGARCSATHASSTSRPAGTAAAPGGDVDSWLGKSFDTFARSGRASPPPTRSRIPTTSIVRFWNDGELRHNYNTDDMEHRVPELVAWATTVMTLNSGDLIACGTNHEGLGSLQDGETVDIEIQDIGKMTLERPRSAQAHAGRRASTWAPTPPTRPRSRGGRPTTKEGESRVHHDVRRGGHRRREAEGEQLGALGRRRRPRDAELHRRGQAPLGRVGDPDGRVDLAVDRVRAVGPADRGPRAVQPRPHHDAHRRHDARAASRTGSARRTT